MANSETIVVTGATGQLGRLVIADLLSAATEAHVIGLVRNAVAAKDLADRGVELRTADYTNPASLAAGLAGADKVLLISANELGQRTQQHRNVIEAAKKAGVKLLVYTSLLHADTSPMALAKEHRETEALIRDSGVPFIILRNGWYTENYAGNAGPAIQHGAVLGSAQDGRIASASRADYAAAAAAVLTRSDIAPGQIYELAGDEAYTLKQFAAELSKQSGKSVIYKDMPEADYKAALQGVGLPEPFAALLAESDAKAAKGSLFDDGRQLSKLIGRPTTTLAQTINAVLAK